MNDRLRMMALTPESPVEIPDKIVEVAGHDTIEGVWRNALNGLTFRLHGENGTRYAKWQPYTGLEAELKWHVDLTVEAEKLDWAGQYVRVPRVLGHGATEDAGWLVTEEIQGTPAFESRWQEDPETAVKAIATGLRLLHDTAPIDDCPYDGTWVESKASKAPEPDRLVVCHGDPCVPNTLINDDGSFAGHVDLTRLGVADRWADLAIATYSISWRANFGRSYDELFFGTYGVQPDYERIRAYRNLWDTE